MHSGHMLLEGTWPDHVRVNMGLANGPRDPDCLRREIESYPEIGLRGSWPD